MSIDNHTADAIKHNAPGLAKISGERIWMEMSKILVGNNPSQILKEMNDLDVLINIGLIAHDLSQASRLAEFQNPILVLSSMIPSSEVSKLHVKWKFTNEQFTELQFLTKFKDIKL